MPEAPTTIIEETTLARLWGAHRRSLDVRLALVVGLAVLLLAVERTAVVAALAGTLLAVALALPSRRALLTMVATTAGIAVALNALTEPGGALVGLGPLTVTDEGLAVGGAQAARIVGLVTLGRLAVAWIEPRALADRIERPVAGGRIGRLLGAAGMTVGLALRMVPGLREEAARLELASRLEPVAADGGRRARIRRLAPLVLPLVAGTVRRADEVARTLDARGYGAGPRGSRLEPLPRAPRIAGLLAVTAGVLLVLWIGRV
ncbi:MAG: energy-coupling factor transporter transmembrane component T [Candidatus Eiseniibacteriota bacterium]